MILNVSSRTDIVAFYSTWFFNRIKEGYVDVRNPFYPSMISRIYFDDVDAIIFCTKNPFPILKGIENVSIPFVFHITLTPYHKEIEPNIIAKGKIIEAIKVLSKKIGKEKIYIRYDPIFLSPKYSISYHIQAFENLCKLLDGYVEHIIISFIDDYKNVRLNSSILKLQPITKEEEILLAQNFFTIANKYHMMIQTCCEEDFEEYGFIKRACMDKELAFSLTGKSNFKKWKSRNCGCVEMVDIGQYNSCLHMCKYCYANFNEKLVKSHYQQHDNMSSLLLGHIEDGDVIKIRKG